MNEAAAYRVVAHACGLVMDTSGELLVPEYLDGIEVVVEDADGATLWPSESVCADDGTWVDCDWRTVGDRAGTIGRIIVLVDGGCLQLERTGPDAFSVTTTSPERFGMAFPCLRA